MGMYCFQCEQTAKGTGCTVRGVCGKDETTAKLQDVLLEVTKGIGAYAFAAANAGARDAEIDRFMLQALFTTVTNVDFDPARIVPMIQTAVTVREKAKALYASAAGAGASPITGSVEFAPASDEAGMVAQAETVGVESRKTAYGPDLAGVLEMILYGLKGAAAYADHALVLGKEDEGIYKSFHDHLAFLNKPELTVDAVLGRALAVGELNFRVMALLDDANTSTYGHPEPTTVRVTPVKGKAILVSGHDLRDLDLLLQQTEGKGVNIYTHGEMLPTLAYPGLKKYRHLVGNYGGAWQDQQTEFAEFPGAVLMTTNCIQRPREAYAGRIFTTGLVAWPGVVHIDEKKDFTPVIEAALAADGFAEDAPEKTILVGFAREAVLSVAPTVIEAVKSGALRHFFLIGGCDGAKPGRNYYTDFAQAVPKDCVILTLACGKYRFNKLDFGDIGGIPRLLDMGQCNDAYSAIRVALALAEAFECGVNDLPLSLVLSWYEQKAVAILLTLLHLGVKNIRLGPTLPAFVTPTVLNLLVENFAIAPTTTPDEDLKAILG